MKAKSILNKYLLCLLFVLTALCPTVFGKIIYVDDDAPVSSVPPPRLASGDAGAGEDSNGGKNDGTSWENAYIYLQDALTDANDSIKPVEIRVAQGIYKPDQGANQTAGDREATFQLINGVTIKGGYAGLGEPDPNARDVELNVTILSGDLNGDDIEVDDPCDLLNEPTRFDNSVTVISGNNTERTCILDGFIITGGRKTGISMGLPIGGAGMYIVEGSPTILNCTFTGNAASQAGGGMFSISGSPTLIDCTFSENLAEFGAGIYNDAFPSITSKRSNPNLINCTFTDNYARRYGGGMYNHISDPNLNDCTFSRNSVIWPFIGFDTKGGGIYNTHSNPILINCTFRDNIADSGGGVHNENNCDTTFFNCTFIYNSAEKYSGGGILNAENCDSKLTNCNFKENYAKVSGGGISNNSNTTLINCVLIGNKTFGDQIYPGKGGGIYTYGDPTLVNCHFFDNCATEGAGLYNIGDAKLDRCFFSGNMAEKYGGGIYSLNGSSKHIITNTSFVGNSAKSGGGFFFTLGCKFSMVNCTFHSNFASNGNSLANDPNFPSLPGYITLTNCILRDGDDAIFDPVTYALNSGVTYSNIQGGWEGKGNIDEDPLFANPGYWADANDPNIIVEPNVPNAVWVEGDYHLKSQAGRYDTNSGSWVLDEVTSPCIDAGNPNTPVGDEPEPNGGIINLGAYGGTAEASKSYILAKIIYVDDDAPVSSVPPPRLASGDAGAGEDSNGGGNDGSSWENAYTFLQDALVDANGSEKPVEIRVAKGTYKPNQGLLPIIPPSENMGRGGPSPGVWPADLGNMASFNLINDVTIKGGYAGLGEPDPNARSVELNVTILSGDLNGDDIEVDDPCDLRDEPTLYENSSNVLLSDENDANAVLDGFTIRGGCMRGISDPPSGGGGMIIYKANPTIMNCTFTKNSVSHSGGGISILSSSPSLINCTFIKNCAYLGAGIYNGKISGGPFGSPVPYEPGNPTLINCKFVNNYAFSNGGGMDNNRGIPNLINCTFDRNFASVGAGFSNSYGNPKFLSCTFIENTAGSGGGIFNEGDSSLTINDCTFSNNIARNVYGGAIYNQNNIYSIDPFLISKLSIINSTFSGNSAKQDGGGICNRWADITLINCTFTGNKAYGEQLFNKGSGLSGIGDYTIINCTFADNWTLQGSTIHKYNDSKIILINSILWNGGNEISSNNNSNLTITYCNIQGGWEGEGNIDVDPLFANPGYWADVNDPNIIAEANDPNAVWVDGDYHLKSQAGRYDPNSGDWVIDDVTSPCIDTGDPNTPVGEEPEPNGGIVNMGAYGGTIQASKSLSTTGIITR